MAASNLEGEIETLIRRGTFLNGGNELKEARAVLERAVGLATRNPSQRIRAHMEFSSVTASEGRFGEGEKLAAAAVQAALDQQLETIAADGLIDLANVLLQNKRAGEAAGHLARAVELAETAGAKRIATRARIQAGLDDARRRAAA